MPADLDFSRCPACKSGPLEAVASDKLRCASCGHDFGCQDGIPILVDDWQRHEAELDRARVSLPGWYEEEQAAETESPWRHHLARRRSFVQDSLRAFASKAGGKAGHLLDLGCGDGNHLTWLKDHAERLYGSDYNLLRLIRSDKRKTGATLFLADIMSYPSHDNFFDVIYFNHVLEHIPDDARALETVARILKPGGLLVLGVPNEGSWWWQLAYRRAPVVLANTDHVNFYTGKTLARKVEQSGLRVTQVKPIGWGPPDWNLDMRMRRYKFWDDTFEWFGKRLLPSQSVALYVLAVKPLDSRALSNVETTKGM